MPRQTVIQIVKDVLNEGDFDTVTTWNQSMESELIGNMISTVFYEFHAENLIKRAQLTKNPDTAAGATYLKIPDDVVEIYYIKDASQNGKDIVYLDPETFLSKLDRTNGTAVTDPGPGGLDFKFSLTTEPTYYTSFDDQYLAFDAANTSILNTDMEMYCVVEPSLTIADATVPDLPTDMFPAFIAEVKSRSLLALNQEINPKVEMAARMLKARAAQKNFVSNGEIRTPKYGRNPLSSRRNSLLRRG
jgi:hypothetical protein